MDKPRSVREPIRETDGGINEFGCDEFVRCDICIDGA